MNTMIELSNKAAYLRKELCLDDASPVDIFNIAEIIRNVTFIAYPMTEKISGICYNLPHSGVIVVNSNHSIGRQRFSIAHELYHLYYDKDVKHSISHSAIGNGDANEKRADQFASYFLIPQMSLYNMVKRIKSPEITLAHVIGFEQYYGVSHKAMLYRMYQENYITAMQMETMSVRITDMAAKLGYNTALYRATPENQKIKVFGRYIASAEQLMDKRRISYGKYESLLLEVFREDIVFGLDGEEGIPLD